MKSWNTRAAPTPLKHFEKQVEDDEGEDETQGRRGRCYWLGDHETSR